MDHLSREARLGAMGVTQWYARVRLPGAAESPVFVDPELGESAVVDSTASGAEAKAVSAPATVPSLPGGATALLDAVDRSEEPVNSLSASKASAGESAVVATPAQPEKGRPLACHLGLYRYGDYVVCSAESAGEWVPQEQSLLKNILFALGLPSADLNFLGEFFWPVFVHARSPLNTEAAFHDVCGAWLAKYQNEKSKLLLFSSSQISDALLSIAQFEDSVLRIPVSLAEMLANPALKSQAWHAMQEQLSALGS